jgi:hypothetical protein
MQTKITAKCVVKPKVADLTFFVKWSKRLHSVSFIINVSFNKAVNSPDYVVSNGRMINESKRMGKETVMA